MVQKLRQCRVLELNQGWSSINGANPSNFKNTFSSNASRCSHKITAGINVNNTADRTANNAVTSLAITFSNIANFAAKLIPNIAVSTTKSK